VKPPKISNFLKNLFNQPNSKFLIYLERSDKRYYDTIV
jgi:hypothetical protein